MTLLRTLLVFAIAVVHGDALKILMYNPAMGHSHIAFQGAIADILIDAGHTVHMVIPEWNPALRSNGTTRAGKIYRFAASKPTKFMNASFISDPFDSTNGDLVFSTKQFELFANTTNQYCDDILANDVFLDELRSQRYDVAISELYEFCNWGWFHGIGIQTKIIISATPLTHMISEFYGIPTPISYVSNVFASYPNAPQLTYTQRAMGMFGAVFMRIFTPKFIAEMDAKLRNKFGADFPEVRTIVQNTSIALVNAMDVLDLPKPISHKIVNVGGIAIKKPKTKLSPVSLHHRSFRISICQFSGNRADFQESAERRRALLVWIDRRHAEDEAVHEEGVPECVREVPRLRIHLEIHSDRRQRIDTAGSLHQRSSSRVDGPNEHFGATATPGIHHPLRPQQPHRRRVRRQADARASTLRRPELQRRDRRSAPRRRPRRHRER